MRKASCGSRTVYCVIHRRAAFIKVSCPTLACIRRGLPEGDDLCRGRQMQACCVMRIASFVMRTAYGVWRVAFCGSVGPMRLYVDGTVRRQDRWPPEINVVVQVLPEPSARRVLNRRDPVGPHHAPGWFGIASTTEVKLAAAKCLSDQVRAAYDHIATRRSSRGRPLCPAGGCTRPGMAHPTHDSLRDNG